jgi:hypothetical protein
MGQIVEQTHDEKVEMYKKCTKMQLIGMLISSNLHLESVTKQLNKPVVMKSEGSDGAQGAAVGQRSGAKAGVVGVSTK